MPEYEFKVQQGLVQFLQSVVKQQKSSSILPLNINPYLFQFDSGMWEQ